MAETANDVKLIEAIARAVWESWTDRRWDSIGKHTRDDVLKDAATALNAFRTFTQDDGK